MVTLYDLLEVNENASTEMIEDAYKKLALEYATNPNASAQENQENEMILNKLKMAYDILINEEKRKKYDKNLAQKRAEDLIKNVQVTPLENDSNVTETNDESKNETASRPNNENYANSANNVSSVNNANVQAKSDTKPQVEEKYIEDNQEAVLTEEEQIKLRQAATAEFEANLKRAKKAEEEYNQAYNEAYNNYMRKMGYNVKEPWTWKRIKNLLIMIIVIFVVCALAWIIPPIRNILIGIYEDNFIIKSLVDILMMIINAILSIFK